MANRFILNETSYHGKGAIESIATEAKARGFQKAFVCSDPDLIKFGVTAKVTAVLEKAGLAYENLKEYGKAVEAYKRIKEQYYNSMEASDIDKYITRAAAAK